MKINWYSALKKSTIGLLLFYIGLVFSQATTPECPVCEDPVNVWYKVSTFEPDKGKVVRLDMSKGKTFTDHQYVYLAVKDLDSDDVIYIMFPKNGDWVSEEPKDEFLDALDEEFRGITIIT